MGILWQGRRVRLRRVNNISNIYKYTYQMGINKPMPTQEIGLYKMAKAKKEMHEAKEMMEKSMTMANAINLAKTMPTMSFMKGKKK